MKNKETKITLLTDRIDQLLGGEIKKLEFGSKFTYTYKHYLNGKSYTLISKNGIMLKGPKSTGHFLGIVDGNKNSRSYEPGFDDIKILGKDILIGDVLRAIMEICPPFSQEVILSTGDAQRILATWNLSLPLHSQEEPVLDFLISILEDK